MNATFSPKKLLRRRLSGYTLLEILVAIAVVSGVAGSSILGLSRLNQFAVNARLQTAASTVAQTKIDRFLTVTPFRPDAGKVASELGISTLIEGTSDEPTVPIYRDPADPTHTVNGWARTDIRDVSTTQNGERVWAYQCEVTVAYKFREKTHWVRMSTIRSAD